MLDEPDRLHLHRLPGSGAAVGGFDAVTHWTRPMLPASHALIAHVEDALLHIAQCLPSESALAVWESAVRVEARAGVPALARVDLDRGARTGRGRHGPVGLRSRDAHCHPAPPLGCAHPSAGVARGPTRRHPHGERLVIQIDGWQFHSSAAQRAKDIAHDAELRLRGYTVLRFGYAQVVHDREAVLRVIRRAIAARLHLAA